MTDLLPRVHDGKLMLVDDDDKKGMLEMLEMLPVMQKVQAKRLIANEKYTVREALERVGVMICERAPKTQTYFREPKETNDDYGE